MARNGSGTYSLPAGNPVVTGTTISSTWANNTLSDIATALTNSLAKDGQTTPTANLPMGTFKFTGLGAGTVSTDSARFDQIFNQGAPTDIASAATVDIGAQLTNFLTVTGTTTITSLGTNYKGPKMLKFAGVLTLTYNSTTLVIPGAASITTAAGDTCIVIPKSTSSGTADGWQVITYQRASGLPAAAGANTDITSLGALTTPISLIALRSYLSGATLSTSGSSTTMSIANGAAMDSTNAFLMQVSATSKTTSSWAVGSGVGGLDTGTIANSTWYYFYIIRRPDTGVVDVMFSTNSSAPTLPTNYTQYRYIGAGLTNGSGQWTKFYQFGDEFLWDTPPLDVNASITSTATNYTISVPRRVVKANLSVYVQNGANNVDIRIWSPSVADVASNGTSQSTLAITAQSAGNPTRVTGPVSIITNSSAQIRAACSVSLATEIRTNGWVDLRGKEL